MKKFLSIFILSLGFAFLLIFLVTYADQNMSNYFPTNGSYTHVHLINSISTQNVSNCFCAQTPSDHSGSLYRDPAKPGYNINTGNCDTGASTSSTPVSLGGTLATYTNAGTLFTDPCNGYLEVCRNDGTAATYPGSCFDRYGNSNSCPTNYIRKNPHSVIFSAGHPAISTWTCCFTGQKSVCQNGPITSTQSGCFAIYSNDQTNGPDACTNVDPNAYDLGCQVITDQSTSQITLKRNCCFNSSTGSLTKISCTIPASGSGSGSGSGASSASGSSSGSGSGGAVGSGSGSGSGGAVGSGSGSGSSGASGSNSASGSSSGSGSGSGSGSNSGSGSGSNSGSGSGSGSNSGSGSGSGVGSGNSSSSGSDF